MTQDNRSNEGIIVQGGSFQSGATAAGAGATAINQTPSASAPRDELLRLLAAVEATLAEHPDQARDPEAARAATEDVADELEAEQPSKRKLTDRLHGLADSINPYTTAAAAVDALMRAVDRLVN